MSEAYSIPFHTEGIDTRTALAQHEGEGHHSFDAPYRMLEYDWLAVQALENEELARDPQILQIAAEVGKLVVPYGAKGIELRARAERIRIVGSIVETGGAPDPGTRLLAGFNSQTGLIYMPPDLDPGRAEHIKVHEITHGLASSVGLYVQNGTPYIEGNGLHDSFAANGDMLPEELSRKLYDLNEAVIDAVAMAVSGLDVDELLLKKEGRGYATLVRDLREVKTKAPRLFEHMVHRTFRTGCKSYKDATEIVEGYSEVIGIKNGWPYRAESTS